MPSPIGHALAGVAAGLIVAGPPRPGWHATLFLGGRTRAEVASNTAPQPRTVDVGPRAVAALTFALVANVPDLDLLAGIHSTYTHSVGAVAIVFLVALAVTRWRIRLSLGIAAAWGSHLLLDWLGSDTSAPIGIMALWPFSREHYQSQIYLFDAISRRHWLPEQFIWGNLKAAAREVLILGPLAWLAVRRATR